MVLLAIITLMAIKGLMRRKISAGILWVTSTEEKNKSNMKMRRNNA
jgi:hypothetical protein